MATKFDKYKGRGAGPLALVGEFDPLSGVILPEQMELMPEAAE
jgi:hypothetical protein